MHEEQIKELRDVLAGVHGFLVRPGISDARFVTAITQLDATWQPVPQVALRAAWVRATAGAVIRAAGGQPADFVLISVDLRL